MGHQLPKLNDIPAFETQWSKTGASVSPPKRLVSSKTSKKIQQIDDTHICYDVRPTDTCMCYLETWSCAFFLLFTSIRRCEWNEMPLICAGFPLDLENLEKWEYTWKTWKYHGILKNLINIMEEWHETWKNLVATKKFTLDSLETIQNSLNYWSSKEGSLIWSIIEMINFLFKWNSISLHIYIQNHLELIL